jgi:NAD(P)-dependent dehydrogenase (short-subunit alcohol dehydrogenase family)
MTGFNPFSLEGKNIFVTGASSGIGRGIAVTCSKMGAKVIINGRNATKLQETYSLMEHESAIIVSGDLNDASTLTSLVGSLPKLDGVVHCAGIGQRIPCKDLQVENVNQVMDINFKAPVMLQAELLRQKKINKAASIVFVASIASWSPSFGNSVYSASKGAIISYSNCLALELAPRKIRVNCISPAMVWTNLIYCDGTDEEQLKEDEQRYPLKRYGKPDDIANLAVYMLSDASSWMTGSNVKITGGGKLDN